MFVALTSTVHCENARLYWYNLSIKWNLINMDALFVPHLFKSYCQYKSYLQQKKVESGSTKQPHQFEYSGLATCPTTTVSKTGVTSKTAAAGLWSIQTTGSEGTAAAAVTSATPFNSAAQSSLQVPTSACTITGTARGKTSSIRLENVVLSRATKVAAFTTQVSTAGDLTEDFFKNSELDFLLYRSNGSVTKLLPSENNACVC